MRAMKTFAHMRNAAAIAATFMIVAFVPPAHSKTPAPQRSWTEEKCVRYREAWIDVLERWGRDDLSAEFMERHTAFIDGGCTAKANVCPRSAKELEIANVLTIRAMNARTASSFLPFACPG
jgi:hypothetical protein